MKIINKFEHNKKFKHIIKPELISISPIEVYKPSKEEKAKELVAGAANKFRQGFIKTKLKDFPGFNIGIAKFKVLTADLYPALSPSIQIKGSSQTFHNNTNCSSEREVPKGATTFCKPACVIEMTSIYPSTTIKFVLSYKTCDFAL